MGIDFARTLQALTTIGRQPTPSPSPTPPLESPVPHLVTSNQPPTEAEIPIIKQAIADAQKQLTALEWEAQSPLERAPTTRQRKVYTDFVQAHQRILSVCRRIPLELLQEIILHLVPQDPRTTLPTRYWRAAAQVCKSWNTAALSIPELWSYVPQIRLSDERSRKVPYLLTLRHFLSLSGDAPLRLRIDAPLREFRVGGHPALDQMVKYVERWESLQMDSALFTYKSCFTWLGIQGKFTSLRYLDLDIWRCNDNSSFVAFRNAPKLEEVSIRGMFPAGMQLPWGQLKMYREKVQNRTGLLTVLNNAKALERLEISETPGEVLPYLTHNLFGSLERLRSQPDYVAAAPTELQVQFKLRRLAFRTQTISPGDLITLLRLAPALEELDMPHPPSYDLQALIHHPELKTAAPLVPNLRRLYIHTEGDWGDEETYRKIARSRCERPYPARSGCSPGRHSRCVPYHLREARTLRYPTSGTGRMVQPATGKPSNIPSLDFSEEHPLCIYFASDNEKFTPDIGPEKERLLKICRNPVAAARFFHYMVNVFIVSLMGFGIDARGIFGDVSAYYATVEQQGRLTLHIHMLIWLKGNLSPQQMRQRIMNDLVWQKAVVEWLESTHCGEFSTGSQAEVSERADEIEGSANYSEVETLPIPPPSGKCSGIQPELQHNEIDLSHVDQDCDCNMNEHELETQLCDCKYCASRRGWWSYFLYRFDTVFLRSNVHSCQRYINLDGSASKKMVYRACTDNRFKRCRARFPRPLHAETKVDPATGALAMKKGEAWVNFVNRVTTFIMGCNTDVTCLMSGTAVKAVIVYVTDYITKQGLKTHVLYDAIQSIISKSTEILVGDMKAKEKARRLMTRIVNLVSAKMEMGAPMISLYLLGNPDHYTSHTFKPMFWKQYMLEARRAFPEEAHDDSSDKLMLMKKDGQYVGLSLVYDYIYRPYEVEELCVYEFIQRCTRVAIPRSNDGQLSQGMYKFKDDHPLSATHALRINCGNVSRIVPNILGPALPRRDVGDQGDYAIAMLSLFKPWRSGLDLRGGHGNWHDAFVNYDFPKRYTQLMSNINLKYECLDARDDYRAQMRQSAGMCGNGLHGIDFEEPEEGILAPEWTIAEEGVELEALENGTLSTIEMDRLRKVQDMTAVLHNAGWDQNTVRSTEKRNI
ncbi:hypothetical protein NMY22_g13132 [Coprinellus aureogranulatus]|nr:hypothetical protein NMY22_g13132 [Coprinellus aureogranulatus]